MAEQTELEQTLREELEYLWGDLARTYQHRCARFPERSTACENLIARIYTITRLLPVAVPEAQPGGTS